MPNTRLIALQISGRARFGPGRRQAGTGTAQAGSPTLRRSEAAIARSASRAACCTDDPAFEKDREAGGAQTLRECCREERNTDSGKHHLPVLQLSRAENRE